MKYKGPVLLVLLAIAVATILLIPEQKEYKEIVAVGQPVTEFAYPDSNGKIWRLSDLKGKVVFINFWATWCTTCKAEMPQKALLFKKMEGKPFQMLGMLFRDDPANLPDYYKENNVVAPTLISPDNDSAKTFGITGVPETFIIDKDGILRERLVGPQEWDTEESLALIEQYL